MRLLVAILLTQFLVISSFNVNRDGMLEMRQMAGIRVKRQWWSGSGSGLGGYFYGHYGGGVGNNYGGVNIGSINIKNVNLAQG
uniref:Uncharacterized protein n=1 Tax=Parascaris univalens TaxID=6257 RepID=A0A915C5G0_PARUN